MYWLSALCVKRPIFATMIVAALIVAGAIAFPTISVDRFPNIDLPTVYIFTGYPGAASSEVESEVTQLIEQNVATVAGIDELRSISSDGNSFVIITFELERNVDAAVQDVRDAVAGILDELPPNILPPVVKKSDLDSSPVMTLAVSGPRTAKELYFLADRYVKSVIESAAGVGEVEIRGAADRAVQVNVDSKRLFAHQLSILDIRDALERQNREVPGGRVDEGTKEIAMRTMGRIEDSSQFADLVIQTINGIPVRLGDVASIVDGTKEVRTLARLNGTPTVVLEVQRQSGENTIKVIEAIKERLPRCENLVPSDVSVTVLQDQSRYIDAALHEIEAHLITGSIFACLTVLFFMRSWRSTVIAAVAIPASIIASFAFMKAFGFSLNNVTMLALVLMVGVVIDDAIVVLENIFRLIEEKGMAPFQAAIDGTREIGLAVLATTVSLVIVFLPVSFLSSVTGRLLFQFGVTASIAILISMLISFTLTPMMCSRMLRSTKTPNKTSKRGLYSLVEKLYVVVLGKAIQFRWLTLLVVAGVAYANIPLYRLIKQDYIPTNVDESEFEVRLSVAQGANMASMDDVVRRVEETMLSIPGVELVLATAGSRGQGSVNQARLYVKLTDIEERTFSLQRLWKGIQDGAPRLAWQGNFTQAQKMSEVRERLKSIDEVRASVRNQTSLRQGAPVDIDFSITGSDIPRLIEFSEELELAAREIPGLVDVDRTLRIDKPELIVNIDRQRAAAMGVAVTSIADTLRVAVGGDDRVSRYRDVYVDDAYDVELRLEGIDRSDTESISQLMVRVNPMANRSTFRNAATLPINENSEMFVGANSPQQLGAPLTRIDNLVTFATAMSPSRIDRLNRQRMVAIRANIDSGYSLSGRVAALQAKADEIGIPSGFEAQILGGGRELEKTFSEFQWVFVMSFVFMYIVLAAQFENLLHPITILVSLPLAVPFGLLGLYMGGESLNVYSALGLLVLFGVVKKAAILQVDHTSNLLRQGMSKRDALLEANRDRLRPILMTTISFVAGMLPLLFGAGPGAEERRSIATLAVCGQTLSLGLTLIAVPVIYSFLYDIQCWWNRTMKTQSPKTSESAPASSTAPTSSGATSSAVGG